MSREEKWKSNETCQTVVAAESGLGDAFQDRVVGFGQAGDRLFVVPEQHFHLGFCHLSHDGFGEQDRVEVVRVAGVDRRQVLDWGRRFGWRSSRDYQRIGRLRILVTGGSSAGSDR